jgi:KaiC/GvpD/RAD55 family RecA-like ATPase/DNA-binding NarL/FixJ family response regulator
MQFISALYEKDNSIHDYSHDKAFFYNKIPLTTDQGVVHTPLLYFWALSCGIESEEEAVKRLANWYKIEDEVFSSKGWLDYRSGWGQHLEIIKSCFWKDDKFSHFVNVRDFTTTIIEKNSKTILPITAWTTPKIEKRLYLNLPPFEAFHLNSELEITQNPEAIVMLTESLEIAAENKSNNANENVIWASWYGEHKAVNFVDWSCLKGGAVYYFITEYTGVSIKEAYETAYAVYQQLQDVKKINLHFIEYSHKTSTNSKFHFMSCKEFAKQAMAILGEDDSYAFEGLKPLTMKELIYLDLPERKLLLDPIMHERSTTLLYAQTNVGKTWLALCMAYTIAVGGTLFERWKTGKARKVLYIDSEMDQSSLQKRIKLISQMKFDERKYSWSSFSNNFYCISRNRSEQDNENFQKDVTKFVKKNKISLLVLDNLTAFTQHNDSAKAWEDIHVWLDSLKANGCAVLLIHHTNKAGEQRGTSATTNAVDNVIRINQEDLNDLSDKIEGDNSISQELSASATEYPGLIMSVHIEKGRDIYGKARESFWAQISPNAIQPFCRLLNPTENASGPKEKATQSDKKNSSSQVKQDMNKEERDNIFQKEVLKKLKSGMSIKGIAEELNCSVGKIYHILGLTKRSEYKAMKTQIESEQNSRHEKILKLCKEKKDEKEIAKELEVSRATVRREIEKEVAKLLKSRKIERATERNRQSLLAIAEEMNLELGRVERILQRTNVQKVVKLLESGQTLEEIIKKTRLPEEVVKKEIARLKELQNKREQRKNKINQIQSLCEKNVKIEDIIKQVDLPEKTIKREYNKCQKTISKPSSKAKK